MTVDIYSEEHLKWENHPARGDETSVIYPNLIFTS